MARRFHLPMESFLDSNGDPLSGAKLYFYESGTTTALDTFSDEGLTTANANPVVADSAGRFGDIWLKEQDYKAILKTSADVTVTTMDPIAGAFTVSGDNFKVSQQSPADLTVQVSAGTLYDPATKTRVSKAVQNSGSITAPTTNPRIDVIHINARTGAIGITTGAEAASPSVPTLGDGLLPLAQIALTTTITEITSAEITDIRELANIGHQIGSGASQIALNDQDWTALASAATVNIGAAATYRVNITGTTTITAFDTVTAGIAREVRFDGVLTLTHNATSLILPGGANITTAAGDIAKFVSEGSGNWRCTKYQKADGTAIAVSLAAGSVSSTELASSAVTQAKLSTATGDLTETGTGTVQTAAGGEYGFWPTTKSSGTGNDGYITTALSPDNAAGTPTQVAITTAFVNRIHTGETLSQTLTVRQRYVQASPPYDLGDGDVPLFIFARVDAAGNILNTYVAPEPPWANNGPTNIRPDFEDKAGRKFKRKLVVPNIRAGLDGTKAKRAALETALAEPKFEMVEITQTMKQADMPLIPHPWLGNDLTGQTIVLLDPVADMTHKLLMLHEQIADENEAIGDLLHDGYLKINNTGLPRACPPGVRACACNWK